MKYLNCQKQINYYYNYFLVNCHNILTLLGWELNQKIKLNRSNIANFFCVTENEISFQPNEIYAKLIVLQLINFRAKTKIYYLNQNSDFFKNNIFKNDIKDLELKILDIQAIKNCNTDFLLNELNCLIWIDEINNIPLSVLKNFFKKIKINNPKIKIFINVSYFFYEQFKSLMVFVDAFLFNPFYIFKILGTVILGIKNKFHLQIKPIIYGGGMNQLINNQFSSLEFPAGFEGGTQNDLKNLLIGDLIQVFVLNKKAILKDLIFETKNFCKKTFSLTSHKFVFYHKLKSEFFICDFNDNNKERLLIYE